MKFYVRANLSYTPVRGGADFPGEVLIFVPMIPLHTYSNFSFLRGVIPVQQLVDKAREMQFPAIALTDIESMHGHIQFAKAALEAGIKPIFGAVLPFSAAPDDYVIVLAANAAGYSTLCRWITRKKLSDFTPELFKQKDSCKNVFLLTPSLALYNKLQGENTYLEIPLLKREKDHIRNKLAHARENKLKAVITNSIIFAEPGDFEIHKVVSAIRERRTMGNLTEDVLCDEACYFLKPESIRKRFAEYDEFLDNSDFIASKCNVNLELRKFKFPIFPDSPGVDSNFLLTEKCREGLQKRFSNVQEHYWQRLSTELAIIDELNFSDYFLVVWDIVREAKKRGMMLIGRGSAANSLVSYCLGFTEVDPIVYDLYFERFMNRSRSSPPDIDLDFSWRERDEIVKYVFEKYGYERVAMISTTVTFRARSAFRETAKVYGFSNEQITPFAKLIPWTSAGNLERLPELFPESRNLPFHEEPWKSIVRIASRLAGFPRHLSIHPSGIIVCPQPITDYIALEFAKNKGLGLVITQPDMYSIEDLGLVKIDLLSQRSLGVLRDTLTSLAKTGQTKSFPDETI